MNISNDFVWLSYQVREATFPGKAMFVASVVVTVPTRSDHKMQLWL